MVQCLFIPCATDILMFCYGLMTFFVIINAIRNSEVDTNISWIAVVTSLLILVFSIILKCFLDWISGKCRVDRLKIFRNNLLIGFGGISICGLVPRFLAIFLFSDTNWQAHTYCAIFPILTAQILYYVFILRLSRPWRLGYGPHELVFGIITIINIGIYIGTLGMTFTSHKVHEKSKVFNLLLTPPLFAAGFVDFLAILLGGLGWRNGVAQEIPLKRIVIEKKAIDFMDASDPKASECEICTLEYSAAVIPRVLTTCGHTICQPCASRFLNNTRIMCPFCRRITEYVRKVTDLPKNHTALEMIKKSSFNCKACKMEYSENRIPRVLIACGHSVCQGCADGRIRSDFLIACPTCKALTGGICRGHQLPKNFAALELVREHRKQLI